ncbi:F17G fimbrial adhesin [Escherichia coli O8]|nr:F17G fimbrial adhesin [Escherichia coli O8]
MTNFYKVFLAVFILVCCNISQAAVSFIGSTENDVGPSPGSYSRTHAMDNLPFVYNTGNNIGYQNANVWRISKGFCVRLDGKVDLPVVGSLDGQSIYGLTEEVGLLIWMGDTNYSRGTAMSGNSWENVFSGWCVGANTASTQGLSVRVTPVILKRNSSARYSVQKTSIGSIRMRPYNGSSAGSVQTTVNFSLNPFTLNDTVTSCRLLTPSAVNVSLAAISAGQLPSSGDEVVAGTTSLKLQCDAGVTVWATLTDATTPSNRSDILTLTGASTATGVGLRIYKNTDSTPLKFGPDSPVKGNENQWQLSTGTETSPSVRLYVKYVNTGEGINPGTVNGISTFTFSYQ